jgi:hypothetical protein
MLTPQSSAIRALMLLHCPPRQHGGPSRLRPSIPLESFWRIRFVAAFEKEVTQDWDAMMPSEFWFQLVVWNLRVLLEIFGVGIIVVQFSFCLLVLLSRTWGLFLTNVLERFSVTCSSWVFMSWDASALYFTPSL